LVLLRDNRKEFSCPFCFYLHIIAQKAAVCNHRRKNYKKFTEILRITGIKSPATADADPEVNQMKEEKKQPVFWEISDPKPPVIRSGHLEDKRQ
jgi:hypothetical protein